MWRIFFTLPVLAISVALGGWSESSEDDYIVCESTYALCTTAQCTPIEEGQKTVFCDCEVKTGYSVGSTPCHDPVDSGEGKQVVSRYYPIKSYAACTNDRPWAWCYDRPCIVDKDDPTKAACSCNVVKDKFPYVMVTDAYSASTCTTGFYSSATVNGLKATTEALRTSDKLKPFDLKVVEPR